VSRALICRILSLDKRQSQKKQAWTAKWYSISKEGI
jgi:hypothetical protein